MSAHKILSNKAERRLQWWKPEDGAWIDIVSLINAFPDISSNIWLASLIGSKVGWEQSQVKRLPLEGRKYRTRTVVLVRSLRDWLHHYNPGKEAIVNKLVDDLLTDSMSYQTYLKDLRTQTRLKSGVKREKKEKEKTEKIGKITSREVFNVWH